MVDAFMHCQPLRESRARDLLAMTVTPFSFQAEVESLCNCIDNSHSSPSFCHREALSNLRRTRIACYRSLLGRASGAYSC